MSESFFFNAIRQLRRAVESAGEPLSILKSFEQVLSDPDIRFQFLIMLNSPAWIEPLAATGFFDGHPALSREENDMVLEAALRYLARMAPTAPRSVAYFATYIPITNPRRLSIAVETAIALPSRDGVMITNHIVVALLSGTGITRTDTLSTLIIRLCEQNQILPAMVLFRIVCELSDEDGTARPSRMDDYRLLQMLDKCAPAIAKVAAKDALNAMLVMLRKAVATKQHGKSDPLQISHTCGDQRLRSTHRIGPYDLAGSLVGPVRNAMESAIQSGSIELKAAMNLLDEQPYLIFKRLRIHILNTFADQEPAVARETLLNRDLFDDHRFKHEYARFIDNRFNLLNAESRQTILSWIEAGPDLAKFRELFASNIGRIPNDQEEERRIEYWKYEKLWWIRHHLTGSWAATFVEMQKKYGEPQMADLNVRMSGAFGRESPVDAEELKGKDVNGVVRFLKKWVPPSTTLGKLLAEVLEMRSTLRSPLLRASLRPMQCSFVIYTRSTSKH